MTPDTRDALSTAGSTVLAITSLYALALLAMGCAAPTWDRTRGEITWQQEDLETGLRSAYFSADTPRDATSRGILIASSSFLGPLLRRHPALRAAAFTHRPVDLDLDLVHGPQAARALVGARERAVPRQRAVIVPLVVAVRIEVAVGFRHARPCLCHVGQQSGQ